MGTKCNPLAVTLIVSNVVLHLIHICSDTAITFENDTDMESWARNIFYQI